MRTIEEVFSFANKKIEPFSFYMESIAAFIPFDLMKSKLKSEVTKEQWEKDLKPFTEENIITEMKEYLSYAYEKAENQRGLSAARSMQKYQTWLYAIGDDELSEECEGYHLYGLPQLNKIKEKYFKS